MDIKMKICRKGCNHSKATFMMIKKVPEKQSQYQKIRKLQNFIHFNKQGISCHESLLDPNFDASSKCCKRMEQSLPLAIEFMGR